MTNNELKFFDPETGKPLHRVPDGATIPKGMPYGFIRRDGNLGWISIGPYYDMKQGDDVARFTREPIAPPLPTPGDSPIIASIGEKHTDVLMVWSQYDARWVGVDDFYAIWFATDDITEWEPVTLVPTEAWDRLRVLDPEDTRDRVDRDGNIMGFTTQSKAGWGESLMARHLRYGPLRFADEVSDDE